MKRFFLALLFVIALTTPSLAVNIVVTLTCKRAVLHAANDRTVLVNRITGEVKYALQNTGKWVVVKGERKRKYQALYDAQVNPKKP